jgi:transcription-repair coupling factor (superfamily II helicase)
LKLSAFIQTYTESSQLAELIRFTKEGGPDSASISGLTGSAAAVLAAGLVSKNKKPILFILSDHESAAYFFNDLEQLLSEKDKSYEERNIFLFPATGKKGPAFGQTDNARMLLRSEVLNRLATEVVSTLVVSYPEALAEKVVSVKTIKKNKLSVHTGDRLSMDFLMEMLFEYGFEHYDFVAEPGQYAVRGGILDVFSFSNDYPLRVELLDEQVASIRYFNPESQLSVKSVETASILPDISLIGEKGAKKSFLLETMPANTLVWSEDTALTTEIIEQVFSAAKDHASKQVGENESEPSLHFIDGNTFLESLKQHRVLECNKPLLSKNSPHAFSFPCSPQPPFNKNFNLLISKLKENTIKGYTNLILSDNPRQLSRIQQIFETILEKERDTEHCTYSTMPLTLHEGFVDHDRRLACYTDHQIFDRYHRFRIRDKLPGRQLMSLKELYDLKPGDYITHIDHGIGVFSGLEKLEVNGKVQEAIRLVYKNNDILYVSIHSLHRISKYSGKEGSIPVLHRLGSNTWNIQKNKAKQKVKDIARDLITLYAQRKAKEGFAFTPDTYLQTELEASFIYEDTPDQEKATEDTKRDMEAGNPMDRLICGDVGFGKTEIAIRAAFKAVADNKQVAVLVPTTILAMQHFYTFSERLKDFPCSIDYISRFRTARDKKETLKKLKEGKLDIIIGTHRLISQDIHFKDLGLLIIDEEQKFGVSAKEKLKRIKINVDTLTLTATPIPRTLQFSLMGARDLSMINTPPPNRYPIITELHVFNEALIRDAVMYEVSRGGQVFFVHNRVQNIPDVAAIIQRLSPDLRVAVGHGQLEGHKLEQIMVDFIQGDYDVLVSTTIIESGLDISNANTIIINNAHHFGLSDLHQMRGRVGRTNRKAFCYLLTPPMSTLTDVARKRLKAIEEFSELGSGFNIAMRDLDIRGAGNLLGAEQSGFISEIGFDMYQKILNEAIDELKETEFSYLHDEASERKSRISDCALETDLELMIPSHYVTNTQERLSLYKELDSARDEAALQAFAASLGDRFGPVPETVSGLLEAVRLRRMAGELGIDKLILKSGKMIFQFPQKENTTYYESETFGKVLSFVQTAPRKCSLRENNGRLMMYVSRVTDIHQAIEAMHQIQE